MKKGLIYLWVSAVVACLLLLVASCRGSSASQSAQADASAIPDEPPILRFLSWEDYLDPALLESFKAQTGIQVEMSTFGSTEQLEALLQEDHRAYDLVVVDDTTLEHYKKIRIIQPINRDWIPNLKNLRPELSIVDPPNEWTVPYFIGGSIIVYNKDYVDSPPTDWSDLWDPAYRGRVALMEDHWDYLGLGMVAAEQSFQESDKKFHGQAVAGFKDFLGYCGNITEFDDLVRQVGSGEMWIGTCYNGDAAQYARENDRLGYVMPASGTMRWLDLLAITRLAEHPYNAHRFINFLLEAENAAQNANYLACNTVVIPAEPLLDPATREDPVLNWSSATYEKCPPYPFITDDLLLTHAKLRQAANLRKIELRKSGQPHAD